MPLPHLAFGLEGCTAMEWLLSLGARSSRDAFAGDCWSRGVSSGGRDCITAARTGLALAYPPVDRVKADLQAGRLRQVLDDWCPLFPGYHLYYPSRRQHSPAFSLLLDALRYREGPGAQVSAPFTTS